MNKRPRRKNEKHLDFVRSLSCCVCGDNTATEAAHIRMAAPEVGKRHVGKGEKPDDLWTVPLCGECHRDQHERGEEEFWMAQTPTDPIVTALALWAHTGEYEVAEEIVRTAWWGE